MKNILKHTFISLLLLDVSSSAICQQKTIKDHYVLDESSNPGQMLNEIPMKTGELKGSFHIYEDWKKGSITLLDLRVINNLNLRYDLKNHVLEVSQKDLITHINPEHFAYFSIFNPNDTSVYMSVKKHDRSLQGVFRILYENTTSNYILAYKPDVEIKDPTYNPALNVGTKDGKYIKKGKHYLLTDNKAIGFKRSLSDIQKIFPQKESDLKKYVKSNKLNLKNNQDLALLIEYCFMPN